MRRLALAAGLLGCLIMAPAAQAQIGSVFGGEVQCEVQPGGYRYCGDASPRSTVPTFDGVPLDVNVAFPPAPASGADGNYPLVMIFHGFGSQKIPFTGEPGYEMQPYLEQGFAVFSMTDRGFHESCGTAASRAADPTGCAQGYIRLMDTRFEPRDAQYLSGLLADEGLIDPQRIGATGTSYGGGLSMALAALKDRMMMPDGSLVPWTSPGGKAMQLAAAAPNWPWSNLAYSLVPNGSTLDYLVDAPYQGPFGVMKQSWVNALYTLGLTTGWYPPESVPLADNITQWLAVLNQGEPYAADPNAAPMLDEISTYHSSYGIRHDVEPAPILFSSGFTDDLFPVDEAVRFYNRTRNQYPDHPMKLFFGDFGHSRGQNKAPVENTLLQQQMEWMNFYVKGAGRQPGLGVEAYTQTCPFAAPSAGPYRAGKWAAISRGEIRRSFDGQETIQPDGGTPSVASAFNPNFGEGACATVPSTPEPGVVDYDMPPAPASGHTMIGAPTVIADIDSPDEANSEVAARLVDVSPTGDETLVARGLWRPASDGTEVFQLHANAWEFDEGHVPRLELLPKDAATPASPGNLGNYSRPSNMQQPITVSDLELRLPVVAKPGSMKGVRSPAPKVLPDYPKAKLTKEWRQIEKIRAKLGGGAIRVKGNRMSLAFSCPKIFARCTNAAVKVYGAPTSRKQRPARRALLAKRRGFKVRGGRSNRIRLVLTGKGRKLFRGRDGQPGYRKLRVRTEVRSAETVGAITQHRAARKVKGSL